MSDHRPETTAPTGPLDRLARAAIVVAAIALLGLVAVQAWQVVARYVLNDSPSWTEPATLLLLATAMSLAAAAAVHSRKHFAFNLLADVAAPPLKRAMAVGSDLVVIAIGGLLAVDATALGIDGLAVRAAGAPWPQGSAYFPLAVGGALMVLFAFGEMLRTLRLRGGER
jgi:TRAP-type C4-dicarboxylate transport system permease small subunit